MRDYWQQPIWSQAIVGKRVQLVRPQPKHFPLLLNRFSHSDFVSDYNAFLGQPILAAQGYIQRTSLPRQQLQQLDWLVEDKQGNALGIASLADLQHFHRRAELLVGFPHKTNDRMVLETTLLVLHTAFMVLGLEKVTSLVYGSNLRAQQATMNLGFRVEGRLASHLVSPITQQREDLFVNAMLKDEYLNHPGIRKLNKRLLA